MKMDKMTNIVLDFSSTNTNVDIRLIIPESGKIRVSFYDTQWNEHWNENVWDLSELGRLLAREGIKISKEDAETLKKCAV